MDVVPTSSNGVNAEADVHGVDPRNIFFSTRQRDAAAFLARFWPVSGPFLARFWPVLGQDLGQDLGQG